MDSALLAIINKANKTYGEGTVLLGKDIKNEIIPRITTGSLALDAALGGGWAANQWNEIVGNESHGKTALVFRTIAANQALDPNWTTLWFASEEFNPQYAQMLGVDLDRIAIVEDNTMEVVFQMAIDAAEQRACDCVVIDSLPALVSIREEQGTMEDLQPGQAAFLTGKFFRKSSPAIKRSLLNTDRPCTGLVVNQWRERIGVMHGDPRTTPGGKAKNFYYFIRVEAARAEWLTNTKKERIGQTIKVKNLKNKTAPPGITGETDFYFRDGNGHKAGQFDTLKEIVNLGIAMGVIAKKGAWYYYGGEQWNGKEATAEAIRKNPAMGEEISQLVLAAMKMPDQPEEPDAEDEPEVKAVPRKRKVSGQNG